MYVKFLSNKKGGSNASIDYLLNDRVAEGTAKILKGDEQLTRAIISSIQKKQKVTVGVLSFEEKADYLTTEQKQKIMRDFEKTLLPGMQQNQYNILWVEHSDKGRLELNFVIPKVELQTQKALQPYYHKQDFSRVEMFEDIQNIKYNLSSKKDPAKQQTLENDNKFHLANDYKEVDKMLHELVSTGAITSRTDLIQTLKKANITITRQGKDYISVKLPDSKRAKKFKKGIYDEQFRSIADITTIVSRAEAEARAFRERDTVQELSAKTKRLERYNKQKAEVFSSKYHSSRNTAARDNGNISTSNKELESREQQLIQPTITMPTTTVKENTDDSNRANAIRRAREAREREQKSLTEAREARERIYKDITARAELIRAEYEQDSSRQQAVKRGFGEKIRILGEKVRGYFTRKWNSLMKESELEVFRSEIEALNILELKKHKDELLKPSDALFKEKNAIAKEVYAEKYAEFKKQQEKIQAMPKVTREDLRSDTLKLKKSRQYERVR